MLDIKETLLNYASTTSHQVTLLEDDKFQIRFEFAMEEGQKNRIQTVWCWIIADRIPDEKCVYFTSPIGTYNPTIDLYQLLRDAGRAFYSTVTLVPNKDTQGKPIESITVQASPLLKHLTKDAFLHILSEVAGVADILEEKYFGNISH